MIVQNILQNKVVKDLTRFHPLLWQGWEIISNFNNNTWVFSIAFTSMHSKNSFSICAYLISIEKQNTLDFWPIKRINCYKTSKHFLLHITWSIDIWNSVGSIRLFLLISLKLCGSINFKYNSRKRWVASVYFSCFLVFVSLFHSRFSFAWFRILTRRCDWNLLL